GVGIISTVSQAVGSLKLVPGQACHSNVIGSPSGSKLEHPESETMVVGGVIATEIFCEVTTSPWYSIAHTGGWLPPPPPPAAAVGVGSGIRCGPRTKRGSAQRESE